MALSEESRSFAELNEDQERKLARGVARQYRILTREERQTKRALEEALVRSHQQRTREVIELEERKATLETTDMALVVSPSRANRAG